MGLEDKAVGSLLLFISLFVGVYYTIWVLITPFLHPEEPIQKLFPSREWAVILPVVLLVLLVSFVGLWIGFHMMKSDAKKKKPSKKPKKAKHE